MSAPPPVTASGTVTASGHIEVSGSLTTAEYNTGDLVEIDIYYDGVDQGSELIGNSSTATYSIVTSSTFGDGTYTLFVVENDPYDSTPTTTTISVTVEVTPTPEPTPAITTLGTISAGSTIEVAGTGTAHDLITLYAGSAVVGTGLVTASGTFDITTTSTFGEGTYTLTAVDSHADGSDPSAATSPFTFTVSSGTTYFANSAASLSSDLASASSGDTIDFAPGTTEIDLDSSLQITTNVTIDPQGSHVVINGNGTSTDFIVGPGATLTLDGMTIEGGGSTGSAGSGGSAGGNAAGGIYVETGGTLILNNSFVVHNSATGGEGGAGIDSGSGATGGFAGGGVFAASSATVIVTDSVIANNYATGGAGGTGGKYGGGGAGGAAAGGIYLASGATLVIGSSDSFYGNGAIGGRGGRGGSGGGVSGPGGSGGAGYLASDGGSSSTTGGVGASGSGARYGQGGSGGAAGSGGSAGGVYSYTGSGGSSTIFIVSPGGGGGGGDAFADYSGMAYMAPDAPTDLMQVGTASSGGTITVTGEATGSGDAPGDTIELYVNGGTTAVGSTTVNPDGSFTITTTSTFADGVYTLQATDTSPSGIGLTSALSGPVLKTLAAPTDSAAYGYGFGSANGLIQDSRGDLFGTAANGGAFDGGTVFEIVNTSGVFSAPTALASFGGAGSGSYGVDPVGNLTIDANGDLFGTTNNEAAGGDGAVFEIVNTSGTYSSTPTVIAPFEYSGAGDSPNGSLYIDSAGNLIGTTAADGPGSGGSVFEIAYLGSGTYASTMTVLASFPSGSASAGGLIADAAGDLFGTTKYGGASGDGSVFELKSTGTGTYANTLTPVVSFDDTNGGAGDTPMGNLIMDAKGDLFGTTEYGAADDGGAVYEIAYLGSGTYATTPQVLYSFMYDNNGAVPVAGLAIDSAGNLYGTASENGADSVGVLFELDNLGDGTYASEPTILHTFATSGDGANPSSAPIVDAAGNVYGTAAYGGSSSGGGTVFEYGLPTAVVGSTAVTTSYEVTQVGSASNGQTIEVSGSGSPGELIYVYASGDGSSSSVVGSATVSGDGTFDFVSNSTFADGTYALTEEDSGGSTLATGEAVVTATPPTDLMQAGSASSGGSVEVSGTGDAPGDLITLYSGSAVVGSGTVSGDGTFDIITTTTFAEGSYSLTATDTSVDSTETSDPASVTVDVLPAGPTDLTQVGSASNGQTIEVTGSGTPGDTVTVYATDNGTTFTVGSGMVNGSGTFDIVSAATFADGTYTLTATESGGGGGSPSSNAVVADVSTGSTGSTGTLVVTATPPTDLMQVGTASPGGTVEITGNGDAPGDTVTLYNGSTVVGSATVNGDGTFDITTTSTFGEGIYRLTATNTSQDGTQTSPPGTLTTLADLAYSDGINPQSGLIMDAAGDLFGTGSYGGGASPDGTVFEIPVTSGVYGAPVVLTTFSGGSGGASPVGGLVADANGDLFGTTSSGGAHGFGTVFEIANTSGTYGSATTIASFTGSGGSVPDGTLIIDANGDLFGTTSGGGTSNDGTVFELALTSAGYSTTPSVLHSFSGSADGAHPAAGLVADADGNLYGTTTQGGGEYATGTVYELVKGADGYTEEVLASFDYADGAGPASSLVIDKAGDVFGTTPGGGASGDGTVFEVAAGSGAVTDLVSFDGDDGSDPIGGLSIDAAGNLFGTTLRGGEYGDGTLFEIPLTTGGSSSSSLQAVATPNIVAVPPSSGSYASTPIVLESFDSGNGTAPIGAPLLDAQGDIYGTTTQGGANGNGTVYEFTAPAIYVDVPPDAPTDLQQVGTASYPGPIEVTGSATAGDTVTVYATDVNSSTAIEVGTATVNSSGTFDVTSTATFADGTYTLTATDTAADGLTSAPSPATATFKNLAAFNGSGGGNPDGGVIADSNGDLFGTTSTGGAYGSGTVFEITDTDGVYSPPQTLGNLGYNGGTGGTITSGLVMDAAGDLFGTTDYGPDSGGTAFELINTSGTYSVPETIASIDTGPYAGGVSGLILDASGNLYGTTQNSGASGDGTVFELVNTSGTYAEQVLFAFSGGGTGAEPTSGVIMDASGDLFGTTEYGGDDDEGAVFELVNTSGTYTEQVLASFSGGAFGSDPQSGLVMDAAGDLFGTTTTGNDNNGGSIFELVNTSGTYSAPIAIAQGNVALKSLAFDAAGNLFAVAPGGGDVGAGGIYEVSSTAIAAAISSGTPATPTLFASFDNGAVAGFTPTGLIVGANDTLFGTALSSGPSGQGTVFEYTPTPQAIVSANAPVIATVSSSTVNGGTITVTGTADDADGDTVTIYAGTAVVGTGTVSSGTFSIVTSTFADGTYSLTATDTSVDGTETSSTSAAVTATVAATPPASFYPDGTPYYGQNLEFGGRGDAPGDTITVYELIGTTSVAVGTATVSGDGSFYVDTTSTFADGTYTFDATNTSADGTETSSASVTTSVIVPAPPPTGPLQVGTASVGGEITVTGYGDAPGDLITLYSGSTVVGTGTVSASGTYTITTTSTFADGSYSMTATDTSVDGTVRSLPSDYAMKILATFDPGVGSYADLISDANGDLFGTTYDGGSGGSGGSSQLRVDNVGPSGDGTVFELKKNADGSYTNTTLYSFSGGSGGGNPQGGLVADAAGDLFGTTGAFGMESAGTVFELTPTGSGGYTERTLFTFNGQDGYGPIGNLTLDANGDIYGAAQDGGTYGYNAGVDFELSPMSSGTYTETTLVNFGGSPSAGIGFFPYGSLLDQSGTLIGATYAGYNVAGSVYALQQTGQINGVSNDIPVPIAEFPQSFASGGSAGLYPSSGVIADAAGDLFGETYSTYGNSGSGTVYEVPKNANGSYGTPTVLATFSNEQPYGGLVMDAKGNLYGTTYDGGAADDGTVFEIAYLGSGTYASTPTTLVTFNGADGAGPDASLFIGADGGLYGTTYGDSGGAGGTVFEIVPATEVVGAPAPTDLVQVGTTSAGGRIEITGSDGGAVGDTITLYNGSTIVGTGTVSASGTFEITTTSTFGEGAYTLTATDTSIDGTQVSSATPVTALVAGLAPTIVEVGTGSGDGTLVVSGLGDDNGDIITLYEGDGSGGSTIVGTGTVGSGSFGSGTFTITTPALADGTYTLYATDTSAAGAVSADSADVTAKVVPLAPSNLRADPAVAGHVTLIGNGDVGDTVTLYVDGGSTAIGTGIVDGSGDFTITTTATITSGFHFFDATETSADGTLTSGLSTPLAVTLAPPAPSNLAQTNVAATTNGGTLEVTGSGEAGDTVLLYNGSAVVGSGAVTSSGTFDIVTTSTFADGAYTLTATETGAGQTSAPSASLTAYESANLFGVFTHNVSSNGGKIYALYEAILGRAPDPGGLENYLFAYKHGTPLTTIAETLLDSGEYTADYGSNAQNTDSAFLTQLYQDALHRAPDSGGMQYWESQLQSGVTRAQVAIDFATSQESQTDLAPTFASGVFAPDASDADVARLYYGLLDRTPDVGGLQYWEQQIHSGSMTVAQAAQVFLGSTEFESTTDGQSNAQYVTGLYETALGRAPDAAGLQYWEQALDSGTSARADVANAFLASTEFQNDTASDSNATYINEVYEVALGRQADPGGLQYWQQQLANGTSRSTFDQDVVGSNEFATNVTAPGEATFVTALYEAMLGRAPDAGGLQYYENVLSSGPANGTTAAANVAASFAVSAEAQNHLLPEIETGFHVA